jgi:adenylate cyclase
MLLKFIQGTLAGLAASVATFLLWAAGYLDPVEKQLWDVRADFFSGYDSPSEEVKLIFIDQYTLSWAEKEHGLTWPWMRQAYVYIIDFIERGEPRAIAFDLLFSETSSRGVADDAALGRAISETESFAQAFMLSTTSGVSRWPDRLHASTRRAPSGLQAYLARNDAESVTMPMASLPVREIATNATVLGSAYARPDGAVLRRAPLFQVFDNRFVPSLGLATFMAGNADADFRIHGSTLSAGKHRIPLDAAGSAILRYKGPSQSHETINAAAVIQSEVLMRKGKEPVIDPAQFRDSYVFVGGTAPGLLDLKSTPVSDVYPGVEIHATVLDNILTDAFINEIPGYWTVLAALAVALTSGIGGRLAARGWHLACTGFLLIILPAVLGFIAYSQGYWLNIAVPSASAAIAVAGVMTLNYSLEGRQKRFIKNAFKQYLSPAVIDRLLEEPERLTLGGETRELTLYFSDIQGFTSMAETLSPAQLTGLLNEYLTAMTDTVMAEGGTIDKYEGDAVIAFWNAPLDVEDHAEKAVRAALRCQDRLSAIQPRLRQMAGSEIHARIGLNTGTVVVGNMGSNQRFDYTFLGDAGNLASRLEGLNKQFGTYVMISEFTCNRLSDSIAAREISRVRVKGRQEAVTVFEPMWPEVYRAESNRYHTFDKALREYYAGRFREALELFEAIRDDPPAAIYASRCRQLADNPPESWEGIWEATEK